MGSSGRTNRSRAVSMRRRPWRSSTRNNGRSTWLKSMLAILKTALRAIRRNVLRSFLTMLGIIVGIAAVIVGVSMGTGAKAEVDKRIASMGQNLLTVISGNMTRGGVRGGFGMAPNLTAADYEAIRKEIYGITAVSPEARTSVQVAVGNQNSFVQV